MESKMVVVFGVFVAVFVQCVAAQTVHVVGDSLGWTIPQSGQQYVTWASANKFAVGDFLKEVFGTEHDNFFLCEDILQFAFMVEIGSTMIALYMRYLFDYLKMANMVNLVGFVDPRQVSSQSGVLSYRTKICLTT
ncbi:hypothetical protein L3X38_016621 [Prunus dulcis]|uniref:Phytocyanin domain-containing protein n=1 Tax=Prunus dulcis TaxID=3755 RepID=A0AAD4W5L7_PRUDU|nr:hypothetical protein L3X38_016621 [Prunus dulcis]